ncbi:MAG: hypothetical protein AAFV43_04535 [Planctomycetota bacterium]
MSQRRLPITQPLAVSLSFAVACFAIGCAQGPVKPDPDVAEERRAVLLLTEEPDGAQTPLDYREALDAEPDAAPSDTTAEAEAADTTPEIGVEAEPTPVVLMGRVGGMPSPWADSEPDFPWRAGEATFFLVDPATADEFAEHAGDEGDDHAADCPFCAREAASKSKAVAAVSFLDDDGKPEKIDARELFGLEKGDTVVVRGIPKLLGGELLVVEADGLYRR